MVDVDIGAMLSYIINIMPQMMVGVLNTMKVYFAAIIPVIPLGVLLGIAKGLGPKPLRGLLSVYTWAWRGTPLLLQLMIMKFGLPIIGRLLNITALTQINEFWGAAAVFALNMAAYITEIMRAAIQSVDKGQYEACRALCIPYWRMMFRVVIPQSIRIAIPPACGEAINLVKDIAIISIISMQDITRVAMQIGSRDKSFSPYIIAFLMYLLLSAVFVKLFGMLEKKATAYD